MINEFKVGDLVYYPSCSQKIYELKENPDKDSEYPLVIKQRKHTISIITTTGMDYFSNEVPRIFHATLETKKILDQLYGIEFEEPSKTFFQKMEEHFDKGGSDVLCTPIRCNTSKLTPVVIRGVHKHFGHLVDNTGTPWVVDSLRVLSSDEVSQFIWSE